MEHFNEQAEINAIFAIGTSPDHISKIFRELKADDFYNNVCKRRFEKYHKAYQAGQYEEFAEQHKHKIEVPGKPMQMWKAINMVKNHALRRKVSESIKALAASCDDYSHSVKELHQEFRDICANAMDERAVRCPTTTKEDLVKVIDGLQNTTHAFYTGLDSFDKEAPIQPGDFVLIGARPGVGKSAIATGMILENFLGEQKRNGLFFCIEMDVRQNYARLSSQMCKVALNKYINCQNNPPSKADLSCMMESFSTISANFPESWFIQGSVSIDEIEVMVETYKPSWIMVDYIQLVKCKGDGHEKFAIISTRLRNLALDHGIAVIGVVQLNRDANGAMPSMSQIKNSGQFEQDATHIFLLDRPESEKMVNHGKRNYFTKGGHNFPLTVDNGNTNNAVLICSKNRNGKSFYSCLEFHPESTSFTEYE